jgi:hypothetical protein
MSACWSPIPIKSIGMAMGTATCVITVRQIPTLTKQTKTKTALEMFVTEGARFVVQGRVVPV